MMQRKLRERILAHATKHRHIPKWKRAMYAVLWGASLVKVNSAMKGV